MGKTVVIQNKAQLEKLREDIMANLDQGVAMIQELMNSIDSLSFFKKIKFEKTVIDVLTGKPENFAEVIDQCQTYLVTIMGTEYLLDKFPDAEFIVNLGNVSGYDIFSKDGTIIAECFASTNYSNNNKLYNDLKYLSENKTAIHKYEFFTDFKATPKVISNAKAKHPDVEIVKFIDTK